MTFRDTPAIEAFVKFLATAGGRRRVGQDRRFRHRQQERDDSASIPTAITKATEAPIGQAKSVVFDMSDEQPASFGATTGQGEWGIFQTFLKDADERHRHRQATRGGRNGGLQEGEVAR